MSEEANKTSMPAAIPAEQREKLELAPLTPDEFLAFKKSFDDSKKGMHPDVRMGISRLVATVDFTVTALSETMIQMVEMSAEKDVEQDSISE